MQYWAQPSRSATLCYSEALTQMLDISHESESIISFSQVKKKKGKSKNILSQKRNVFDICLNTFCKINVETNYLIGSV